MLQVEVPQGVPALPPYSERPSGLSVGLSLYLLLMSSCLHPAHLRALQKKMERLCSDVKHEKSSENPFESNTVGTEPVGSSLQTRRIYICCQSLLRYPLSSAPETIRSSTPSRRTLVPSRAPLVDTGAPLLRRDASHRSPKDRIGHQAKSPGEKK